MPVIEIYASSEPPRELPARVATRAAEALGVPVERVLVFWRVQPPGLSYKADWQACPRDAPAVLVSCRKRHETRRVRGLLVGLNEVLTEALDCRGDVFLAVRRIRDDEILGFGKLWE